MKKRIFYLVCISIICFFKTVNGQNRNRIDSLLNVLRTANEDTNKVNIYILLGQEAINYDADSLRMFAEMASKLSNKIGFFHGQVVGLQMQGTSARLLRNYPKAVSLLNQAFEIAKKSEAKDDIFRVSTSISNTYRDMGEYKMELEFRRKALQVALETKVEKYIAGAYGDLGGTFSNFGDYDSAMFYSMKSLASAEKMDDKKMTANCNGTIAIIYTSQHNYQQGLNHFLTSLKLNEEIGNKRGIMVCQYHIAEVNKELKKYDDARNYYNQCLQISEGLKDLKYNALNFYGIGQVLSLQNKFEDAISNLKKSISISEQSHDKETMAMAYSALGNIYVDLKKFSEATNYIALALEINKANGKKDGLSQNYKSLAKCYYDKGDFKKAYENVLLFTALNDTLLSEEIENKNAEIENKYQAEKKEKEIILLTKNKEIQDLEIKKQRLLTYSFMGGLGLVLLFLLFGYRYYRTKQVLRLQDIRNKIAGDLHDDIGSTLNSISVYSEVAKKKDEQHDDALEMIGDASRKIIDTMSDIVWTINPDNDSFEKIIFRMKALAYNLFRAKKIEFTFRADESLNERKLTLEERRNFYLIFKEAVNNLVKYSEATSASIILSGENNSVKLHIEDNGIGFDTSEEITGNGLKSMNRRAAEMNAQFKIESSNGNGTQIELILKA